MATQRESDEAKHEIQRPEGDPLEDLPLFAAREEPPPAPRVEDRRLLWEDEEGAGVEVVEPDLLGPAQRSDRSWGTLAAAALLLVSLLGAFLWYQRPSASRSSPPPYAPPPAPEQPAAQVPLMNPLDEPDAPPAEAPQIIEELPAEPEPQIAEPAPLPVEPLQIAEEEEIEDVRPEPRRASRPERPRSGEPARVAEAPAASAPAPKRAIRSGPPASRMADILRPGPGVEMPVPLAFPDARYPSAARGRGLKVDVHLDILVDESGKVLEAVVREGDTSGLGFNEAAVDAALATRFQPATRWDLPGKAWTELIIQFEEGAASP